MLVLRFQGLQASQFGGQLTGSGAKALKFGRGIRLGDKDSRGRGATGKIRAGVIRVLPAEAFEFLGELPDLDLLDRQDNEADRGEASGGEGRPPALPPGEGTGRGGGRSVRGCGMPCRSWGRRLGGGSGRGA
ncbi:MAG: hypothetical protein M5U12_16695 [Verrucomicrobia bacterium]|nr:hypothetical protein [Verrucomicrobiota bacterium]